MLRVCPDNAPAACRCLLLQLGLVGAERAASFQQRRQQVEDAEQLLDAIQLSSSAWARRGLHVSQDGDYISAAQMLTRPGITLSQLAAAAAAEQVPGWQQLQELAAAAAVSAVSAGSSLDGSKASSSSSSSDVGSTSAVGSLSAAAPPSAVDTAVSNCYYR